MNLTHTRPARMPAVCGAARLRPSGPCYIAAGTAVDTLGSGRRCKGPEASGVMGEEASGHLKACAGGGRMNEQRKGGGHRPYQAEHGRPHPTLPRRRDGASARRSSPAGRQSCAGGARGRTTATPRRTLETARRHPSWADSGCPGGRRRPTPSHRGRKAADPRVRRDPAGMAFGHLNEARGLPAVVSFVTG